MRTTYKLDATFLGRPHNIFGSCRRSTAKASSGIRMHNNSRRNPTRGVAFHALPRHMRSLTTATEPLMPAANHLVTEGMDRRTVKRHTVVLDVALSNRTNVLTLVWNRLMPSP